MREDSGILSNFPEALVVYRGAWLIFTEIKSFNGRT